MWSPGIGIAILPFAFVLIVIAIPFLFAFAVILFGRSRSSKESRKTADEEAVAYQDLHHGFQRMEERIEALETILMEKSGRSSKDIRSGSDSFD